MLVYNIYIGGLAGKGQRPWSASLNSDICTALGNCLWKMTLENDLEFEDVYVDRGKYNSTRKKIHQSWISQI